MTTHAQPAMTTKTFVGKIAAADSNDGFTIIPMTEWYEAHIDPNAPKADPAYILYNCAKCEHPDCDMLSAPSRSPVTNLLPVNRQEALDYLQARENELARKPYLKEIQVPQRQDKHFSKHAEGWKMSAPRRSTKHLSIPGLIPRSQLSL